MHQRPLHQRTLLAAAACAATALAVTGAATATAGAAPAQVTAHAATAPVAATPRTADYNGDGYPDLAVSAHTATVGGIKRAGAIAVAYGSPKGLRYDTATVVSEASEGVPGDPVENGRWRENTAFGDLDGDGYDDLVLHWNYKDFTEVVWGGPKGLVGPGTLITGSGTPADPSVQGGWNAGVGDVDGDGTDDLVTVGRDGGPAGDGISVRLGPLDRTTGKATRVWHRKTDTLDGVDPGAVFVGDTTGDGRADISMNGWGGHLVLKGSAKGLVRGAKIQTDHHGASSFAFGDLDKDGYQDLVLSWDQLWFYPGGPDGLSTTKKPRVLPQVTSGSRWNEEHYGDALAIGDTDRDGYPDLVVGAPYLGGAHGTPTWRAGGVAVLRGSASGPTATRAKIFTQNSAGIPGSSEVDDHFGSALALIDSDRNGSPELYVGGNGEDRYRGRVWRLPATRTGLTGTGATSFTLTDLGGPAGPANFGYRFSG
ncbi:FG-GAP and VCBS repeat-containing protein [Streptomyces sp. NPDC093225]|uniref:FG-GAP and VCBS repeat-containing protein n=1 Tax=Streptomyces sp. NPDC093225 TaxID=3366034 RepID=UPI00382BA2CE